jgi:phytoene desaturase
MGGTGALVRGLVRLIEGHGNALICNADVREILVRDGAARGVLLVDGERIDADIVVSNADSATTYRRLLPAGHRKHWTDRRLARARYSMSLFVWYFGTRRRYADVAHHTLVLGPRYSALVRDVFTRKVLANDMSLYLHRPTATDPAMAPDGCDAFYALSPVPHLDSGTDWAAEAERYRARVARRLSETVLPGLEDCIATSRTLTPLHFQTELASERGAAFGLEPILSQSAWFRPHNRSEDVERLYLVGAGTHPGAGLPGVLSSARILDRVVQDVAAFA